MFPRDSVGLDEAQTRYFLKMTDFPVFHPLPRGYLPADLSSPRLDGPELPLAPF